jgi:hypothetical protein
MPAKLKHAQGIEKEKHSESVFTTKKMPAKLSMHRGLKKKSTAKMSLPFLVSQLN